MSDIPSIPDIPDVIDNLLSTSTVDALSANQGKVLSDMISGIGSPVKVIASGTGISRTLNAGEICIAGLGIQDGRSTASIKASDMFGLWVRGDNMSWQGGRNELYIVYNGSPGIAAIFTINSYALCIGFTNYSSDLFIMFSPSIPKITVTNNATCYIYGQRAL